MAVTEVTEESWFSRLGGAFKGILTGIVLFILAIPLLFWNEGRAVRRAAALKQGAASVVSRIWAMRYVNTRVLPDPAPAKTRSGPSVQRTASLC